MSTFATIALPWLEAGYDATLPLPHGRKWAPPAGYTGHGAITPSMETLHTWLADEHSANGALRLPENLVGIDVDAYKGGSETIAKIEEQLGKLPATISLSAREDGSGIFLFRNVSKVTFPGGLGTGVEVIQPHHRYAVLPGSLHPTTGDEYRLRGADSPVEARRLPRLPRAWVRGLQALREAPKPAIQVTTSTPADLETCPWMVNALSRYSTAVAGGESRYDAALRAAWNIARLSQEGHYGAEGALGLLREAYLTDVSRDRGAYAATAEYNRMVKGLALIEGNQCSHNRKGA